MNNKGIVDSICVTVIIIAVIIGILAVANWSIEASKYHHKTRVGQLLEFLAPYEDCQVIEEINNPDSTRRGGVIVTLKCQK